MKILPITNHLVYQNTLFPVEQKLTGYIYAAVPDIVTSKKIIFIQRDCLPWFSSSNIIQFWIENFKVEIIALIADSPEKVELLFDEYSSFYEQYKQKQEKDSVVNKLNKLYREE
jgi:hypothetical protein